MPVGDIVDKAWDRKLNSIPTPTESSNAQNDLDIPSFLRKNKGLNTIILIWLIFIFIIYAVAKRII